MSACKGSTVYSKTRMSASLGSVQRGEGSIRYPGDLQALDATVCRLDVRRSGCGRRCDGDENVAQTRVVRQNAFIQLVQIGGRGRQKAFNGMLQGVEFLVFLVILCGIDLFGNIGVDEGSQSLGDASVNVDETLECARGARDNHPVERAFLGPLDVIGIETILKVLLQNVDRCAVFSDG